MKTRERNYLITEKIVAFIKAHKKDSCPEIPYFGAHYPDAGCIDGRLWDLDSDEPGLGLTQGGDAPCPYCNPREYVLDLIDCEKPMGKIFAHIKLINAHYN